MISFAVLAVTLLVILPSELPDKTLVASLVLATRYRPWPVLAGVSAAFLMQCAIAVTAGSLLTLLPHRVVLAVAAAMFAFGAFVVLRESIRNGGGDERDEVEGSTRQAAPPHPMRVAAISFGVLFAAEWGDASQLATAALNAHYNSAPSVFLGSFLALVGVATVAVFMGKTVLRYVPLVWVHRASGALLGAFAVVTAVQAAR